MKRRAEFSLEKKFFCLSFKPRAIERHLVERHDAKGYGQMTCALVNVMRDLQFSVCWIVNVSSMLASPITESLMMMMMMVVTMMMVTMMIMVMMLILLTMMMTMMIM